MRLMMLFLLVAATAAHAQITGTVKLDGKAPEMDEIDMSSKPDCANMHTDPVYFETVIADAKTGALKNVVVSIKHDDPSKPLGDEHQIKTPLVLSQKGCMFVPHVMAVMIGQPITIKNEDTCGHNVHSLAQNNPQFIVDEATKDDGTAIKPEMLPKVPETFQIKCDVHGWMVAWMAVFDHPYFAVTGDDGTFSIDTAGLPDGDYTFVFWQEQYGSQEVKGTVKDHKATVDCTFKADAP